MNHGTVNEIREALSRLPSLGRSELRAEWQRLYGTDAPVRLGRELLIGAIAWRLQENMLGGLRPELHVGCAMSPSRHAKGADSARRAAPQTRHPAHTRMARAHA